MFIRITFNAKTLRKKLQKISTNVAETEIKTFVIYLQFSEKWTPDFFVLSLIWVIFSTIFTKNHKFSEKPLGPKNGLL